MKAAKTKNVIIEKLERITIRYRSRGQRAYCSSCGKSTIWLTAEQAREIFDAVSAPIDGVHQADAGPGRLICAESIVVRQDEENQLED